MADVKGVRQLGARINAIGGRYLSGKILREWQLRTVFHAKTKVPRKTGNLGRTIHPGSLSRTEATVEVSASYAKYVEYGTRRHIIRPRYARVLAWGGARRLSGSLRKGASPTNFAMYVNHPGTKPQPFLNPAAQQAMEEMELAKMVRDNWNEAA